MNPDFTVNAGSLVAGEGRALGLAGSKTAGATDSFSGFAVILFQMRETAFLQLFDDHHAPLFRFAYRLTGSISDAEDIVQECFLSLLRPGCTYDPGRTPIRTYLYGAVRNQWLKRQRRAALAAEADPDLATETSPESDLLSGEIQDAVAQAISQLPDTQREALILAHYEQLPLAEIARILEIEVGAVKSRLERARARLRETLAAYAPPQRSAK